jgi:hypothetical protein
MVLAPNYIMLSSSYEIQLKIDLVVAFSEHLGLKRLAMYNNAWTNGRGDYVLKDSDDGTLPVEDPTEWHKLKIINRNDPNYRPEKYGD